MPAPRPSRTVLPDAHRDDDVPHDGVRNVGVPHADVGSAAVRAPRRAGVVPFATGLLGAALVVAVTVLVPEFPAPRADAQDAGASLLVSGMRIDGKRARARIRLRNTSPNVGDVMFLRYTVRGPDAGAPLSLPGAGDVGLPLPAGQVVEIDLDAAVQSYRRSLGLGPYAGPVQFVSFGYGGVTRSFGPDTIVVDAQQTEGRAVFDAVVEWR